MTHPHSHSSSLHTYTLRRLWLALIITLAFVLVEVVAGMLGNSLALLSDAAHNLTDVMTLGLSWYAMRLTARSATASKTFGYHRAGILVALVNSLTLILVALWIFYEAYQRLLHPQPVAAGLMIAVAALALLVNLGTALLVRRGSQQDLNLKSAYLHLLSDAISTAGALIAGVLIFFTEAYWLDPLISIFIGILILWNAWRVLRKAVDILLESAPPDVPIDQLVEDVLAVPGVHGVHDLHVWSISQSIRAFSAHLVIEDISIGQAGMIQEQVNSLLRTRYQVGHTTLQVECIQCNPSDLYCALEESELQPHG